MAIRLYWTQYNILDDFFKKTRKTPIPGFSFPNPPLSPGEPLKVNLFKRLNHP